MNKVIASIIAIQFLMVSSYGEMRIWTSTKGDTIEAEFVSIIGSKVVLTTPEGKTLKVPKRGLCKADHDYLAQAIPPTIEIDVDMDKDSDTLSSYSSDYGSYDYQRKAETTKCTVSLEKTNQEPCNREFTAKVYLIGEHTVGDKREVLSFAEHTFSFKNSKTTQFNTTPVTVEYTKSSYSQNNGTKYEGYLVVIEDESGGIVKFDASQTSYEKSIHKFKDAQQGTEFDKDFDIMNPVQNTKKRKNR